MKLLSIRRIEHLVGVYALIGGVLLVLSSCITVASMILRELDLPPISEDSEIQSFTNLLCFFFFLPYSIRASAHLKVSFLTIPERFESIRRFIVMGAWISFLLLIFFCMIGTMVSFFKENNISAGLELPIWILIPPILSSIALSLLSCLMRNTK